MICTKFDKNKYYQVVLENYVKNDQKTNFF